MVVSPGDNVLDIGANIGLYTRVLANLVSMSGKVFAFEPLTENFAIVKDVLGKSETLQSVRLFQLGVSNQSGKQIIKLPNHGGFSGLYLATLVEPFEPSDTWEEREIDTIRLDSFSELPQKVSFIKCDVEGAEVDVIKGGIEFINSRKPTLLIELAYNTFDEVFGVLNKIGYKCFMFYNSQLEETELYRHGRSSNYVFMLPGSSHWERLKTRIKPQERIAEPGSTDCG